MNSQLPRKPRLEPSLAKIGRAREHCDEVQRLTTDWQKSLPVRVGMRRDPATRRLHYVVEAIAPLPRRLPLVVGDMMHDLRSALDHSAYQLFLANGGTATNARHVAFPIAGSAGDYPKLSTRKLNGVAPAAKDAIDALRPFKGGEDRFYQISELDNADKHRLILVAAAQLRSVSFGTARLEELISRALPAASKIEIPSPFFKVADPMWPLKVGDVLSSDLPDAQPDPTTKFMIDVALGETGVCDGDELLGKMNELLSFTESIIDGLEVHL